MSSQARVNILFSADTSQAKTQIQDLYNALGNISRMPTKASSLFDDTQIRKASVAAMELQQHLLKATNVDTGKLDLSRFSTSLKAANKSLQSYSQDLINIGPTGQQAFMQLARSISQADAPVTRVNKKLAEFGEKFINGHKDVDDNSKAEFAKQISDKCQKSEFESQDDVKKFAKTLLAMYFYEKREQSAGDDIVMPLTQVAVPKVTNAASNNSKLDDAFAKLDKI